MISESALTIPIARVAESKPKHSMLPLLTILFLISYSLMVLVVVEQNRTIISQRWLISELMSDSKELSSLKGKLLTEQHKTEKRPSSKAHTPAPSIQVPQMKEKARRSAPERPPRLASDAPDVRRALNLI